MLPLRQLNYLKEFFFDPCDAPLTVYAKAFFPAALQLVITWFTPDLSNILFNATKPTKAIAKRRSGRKGRQGSKAGKPRKGWMRFNPFAFDQDEFIGKQIGATTDFQQRRIGGLEFRLWIVFGILERVGYWIFVINTVVDFFFNWMSIAEQSEFCQQQRAMVCLRERPPTFSIPLLGWYGFYCPIVLKQRGLITGQSSIAIPAGQWITVSVGGTAEAVPDQQVEFELRLTDGLGHIYAEASGTSGFGEPLELAAEARVRGPGIVAIEHRVSYPTRTEGFLSAHGIPSPIR